MRPCLKHFQIKVRLDALNLTADVERVISANHRVGIAKLKSPLLRLLRHTKRSAILDAWKSKLWSRRHRQGVVAERAEAEVEIIHVGWRDLTRVTCHQNV